MKFRPLLLLAFLLNSTTQTVAYSSVINQYLTPTNEGTTYAVIVGVADYKYGRLNQGDLQYSSKDAFQIYTLLTETGKTQISKDNIVLLLDDYATKQNILFVAGRLFAKAKANDRIIFYFSGHGLPNYLMPFDATSLSESYISFEELKGTFRTSKATSKFCIIDACHANSVKGASSKMPTLKNNRLSNEPFQIAVMVSAQAFQSSFEVGQLKQGVFTHFLLKGLKGAADKNKDSILNIGELHKYVYAHVKEYTKGEQIPHTFGQFPINMPIIHFFKKAND